MRIRRLHVVAALALACIATQAAARPHTQTSNYQECFRDEDRAGGRMVCASSSRARVATAPAQRATKVKVAKAEGAGLGAPVFAAAAASSSALVAEARRYLGTNPTSRRSLWCGAFMDLVLRRTGHKPGSNLAAAYAAYGRRVDGPQVGAIAVMSRGKRGGHVGVVSGVTKEGNVIIVSGNHNNTVAESVYPRSRIYAYVMPDV